ncbi:alpha/beta hydrolase [Streptomyces sp. NPDC093085]|uniref:alpha/beta fold hydrolase n=1 Tax=Streptomyces sp. NPDC093085 TaxID=3155068 RepID=UPI00342AD165
MVAFSADGTRIHVEVHGEDGRPAVVLCHGWACSSRFWRAQISDLALDHRVIVYDQRGHGRSGIPAVRYGTDALADDLEAVLRLTFGPGERAVLVGHSMGGMGLMAAARRAVFREHAGAVLLCATGSSRLVPDARVVPLLPPGAVRTWVTGRILSSRLPLGPVTPLSRALLRYGTMGAGAAPDRVAVCADVVHECPRRVRVAWARVLGELDLDAEVRELRVPAAVLSGLDDRLTPPVRARALAGLLPECAGLTLLTGVGHMAPVEAPEAVNAGIRGLVDSYLGVG